MQGIADRFSQQIVMFRRPRDLSRFEICCLICDRAYGDDGLFFY
jgi:hypothetical protein